MFNKKKFILLIKVSIILFIFYYFFRIVDTSFVNDVYEYYYISLLLIPIFLLKFFLNAIKISYLLKILNKKNIKISKIFKILLQSNLSHALPGSFFAKKAWVDINIIKQNSLNLIDYIKFNLYIILFPIISLAILYTVAGYTIAIIFFLILFLGLIIFFKRFNNYYLYFLFFILNVLTNIMMSFIIISFVDPSLMNNNIINIFLSSLISIYLDAFSILPFNIGYAQVIYSLSFEYFSLPRNIALSIATIKQISLVILIIPILFSFIFKTNIK
tara:strand:+ start:1288 stop:2103 length:816 start_codon:yes stop_codon:yes gene_type:complete